MTSPVKPEIADALKSADWSNTSIGNKALILAAIEALARPGAKAMTDLKPGWLKRDVDRASQRVREWRAQAMSDPDHHTMMEEHYSYGLRIQDLEAEIERLTGLQQEIKKQSDEIERLWGERAADKAEIARLRAIPRDIAVADSMIRELQADNARLRATLAEYANDRNWDMNARFDPHSGSFDGTLFARRALEPKP